MDEMVEVEALRAHRNGYAPQGKATTGECFKVPLHALFAMVRQKLVRAVDCEAEGDSATEVEPDDAENDRPRRRAARARSRSV